MPGGALKGGKALTLRLRSAMGFGISNRTAKVLLVWLSTD